MKLLVNYGLEVCVFINICIPEDDECGLIAEPQQQLLQKTLMIYFLDMDMYYKEYTLDTTGYATATQRFFSYIITSEKLSIRQQTGFSCK